VRTRIRILTDKWWVHGPVVITQNKCISLWESNGSRFNIYVGVKKKTLIGNLQEYDPNFKTSHKFGSKDSISLCTIDDPFERTYTLENLSYCKGDYKIQDFPLYLSIPAQPLDQNEDRVVFLW
jgi:hypothetical protein